VPVPFYPRRKTSTLFPLLCFPTMSTPKKTSFWDRILPWRSPAEQKVQERPEPTLSPEQRADLVEDARAFKKKHDKTFRILANK
jgi:hypothetical protein